MPTSESKFPESGHWPARENNVKLASTSISVVSLLRLWFEILQHWSQFGTLMCGLQLDAETWRLAGRMWSVDAHEREHGRVESQSVHEAP